MGRAGCVPDLKSYSTVISDSEEHFKALDFMKQMANLGSIPRQGTIVKLLAEHRPEREIWKA